MYRKIYLLIFLCVMFDCLYGQSNIKRKIDLAEVTVTDKKETKQAGIGSRTTTISKAELKRNATRSLAELLLETSPIQIKSMGQGAMATASFRGTSSSHTKVMWNGITINSPQLGNFDFSQVPIYFIDNISLYHGSSAQKSGSGAIGGTVHFSTDPRRTEKPSVSIMSEYASNNTLTEALSFRISKGMFTSSTRAFYQQSDNDYKYLNKVYSNEHKVERRESADYQQAGLMQEFYIDNDRRGKWSLIGWWQFDDRSLPQSIIVNAKAKEKSSSENIRTMFGYEKNSQLYLWKLNIAYLNGTLDYERQFGEMDKTENRNHNESWITQASILYKGLKKWDISANLQYQFDKIKSESILGNTKSRNSYAVQIAGLYRLSERITIDAQSTVEIVDNDPSIIYNISGRYNVINRYLTLKASNSYNHRNPSLNDLYWEPGGNPDLNAERGFSWDITAISQPKIGPIDFTVEGTYFHMDIQDWIMWIPKGNGAIWEPVNFSNVISQGAEVNGTAQFQWGKFRNIITGNYGYTKSVDNSNRNEGTQGKQLPYIPLNRWNTGYRLWYNNLIWFHYNTSFTDVRYTSADESYQTEAYTIHNVEMGVWCPFGKANNANLSVKIENLFNAYYESTQYYPMPRRMIWGRLSVLIN